MGISLLRLALIHCFMKFRPYFSKLTWSIYLNSQLQTSEIILSSTLVLSCHYCIPFSFRWTYLYAHFFTEKMLIKFHQEWINYLFQASFKNVYIIIIFLVPNTSIINFAVVYVCVCMRKDRYYLKSNIIQALINIPVKWFITSLCFSSGF